MFIFHDCRLREHPALYPELPAAIGACLPRHQRPLHWQSRVELLHRRPLPSWQLLLLVGRAVHSLRRLRGHPPGADLLRGRTLLGRVPGLYGRRSQRGRACRSGDCAGFGLETQYATYGVHSLGEGSTEANNRSKRARLKKNMCCRCATLAFEVDLDLDRTVSPN